MNIPKNLKYTPSHEWMERLEDDTVRIGLTDHAQHELGDLVFVNLPQVGDVLKRGESFADVESVKAVSDVYAPVSGTVVEVNQTVIDDPALINNDAYNAWLVRLSNTSDTDQLIDADAYENIAKEG